MFSCVLPLWFRIALFCLTSSILCIFLFDFNALVAPVMKMLAISKVFLVKTIPAWIESLQLVIKKGFAKLSFLLGGWEAWSFKKFFRHTVRFIASLSARIVILTFLINMFVGRERKGLKKLPTLIMVKLRHSRAGRLIDWWNLASDRKKRLLTGVVLCLFLIAVGQALVGVSVLVFDIVWECIIALSRILLRFWRFLYPLLTKLVPNFIGSFITNRVVPFFTNVVPLVKDDHRVLYVKVNFRERFREYKKRLLKYSRARRPSVRAKLSPLVSPGVKQKKDELISTAAEYKKDG